MHLLRSTRQGVVEINFSWLPYCMALDKVLIDALTEKAKEMCLHKALSDGLLEEVDKALLDIIRKRYEEFSGADAYVEALSKVNQKQQ